jgi:hypothetical protein
MKKFISLLIALITIFVFSGCTTTGYFKVPKKSKLYIYKRPEPVKVAPDGSVEIKPFFWTAAGIAPDGGIPYKLTTNDGKLITEGYLRTKFRLISIIWTPFAFIYWPMGFNSDITYDLINNTQR